MSWQAEVFARLRDRQWYKLGDIFEAVEQQIPLHYAMRHAMQPNYGRTEMPLNSVARWRYFICALSIIGVEGDAAGGPRQRKWNDRVRLRYVADRACGDCDGPVIKATWSSHKAVVCLACEARAAAQAIEREQAAQAIAAIAAGPVRPVWEQPPYQPPQPPPQITILHPTRGWWFRARRAFAQYIKLTRLPSWSPTRIWREIERARGGEMLARQGKPPVTKQEYDHWLRNYVQSHPP